MSKNFGEKNYIYCQFFFDYIRHIYQPVCQNIREALVKFFYIYCQFFWIILDINVDQKDHVRHKNQSFIGVNPDTFRGTILR
jgi:hypothetical protein